MQDKSLSILASYPHFRPMVSLRSAALSLKAGRLHIGGKHSAITLIFVMYSIVLVWGGNCFAATYEGRDRDSKWRTAAQERIERFRKAGLDVYVQSSPNKPVVGASVRVRMKSHEFAFGSAVSPWLLMAKSDSGRMYRSTILRNFNKVTIENDLKWEYWDASKKSPDRYHDIKQTFSALEWLKENNIRVRGHYASWAPVEKYKLYQETKNRPEVFRRLLFDHIDEEIPRIGNLVSEWDVVNHIIANHGKGIRLDTLFGKEIYLEIFGKVKKLNPSATLYVNEGNLLTNTGGAYWRRNRYKEIINYLVQNKAPIEGIGFMGHFKRDTINSPEKVLKILDDFAQFGLPIQITEFDVRFGESVNNHSLSEDDLQLQADYTRDFMTAIFSHPSVKGFVLWGFWEGRHWYPNAALYRRDWSPKANGRVWEELVCHEWWTNCKGMTDGDGRYSTRGFLGDYEIEVEYESAVRKAMVSLEKGGTSVVIDVGQNR